MGGRRPIRSRTIAGKTQLIAQVAALFAEGRQRRTDQATDEQELYEQIGRLQMEVDWFEKKLPRSAENLALMREIDRLYSKRPFFGTRQVREHVGINRKRTQRLMRLLGLEAVCPGRSTSRPSPGHKV